MIRTFLTLTALSLTLSSSASANDIADFFRAISRPAPAVHNHRVARNSGHGHDHDRDRTPIRAVGRSRSLGPTHRDHDRVDLRHGSHRTGRPVALSRSGFSVSLNFGSAAPSRRAAVPPVPVYGIAPAPAPVVIQPPAHRVGEIVTCPVALEPHVDIQGVCNVAPRAVPQVVAVRDPHLGPLGRCVESVVYVEVLAPPFAPRRVRVSDCGTEVCLDYGRYEVHIVSCEDVIHISYEK